MKRIFASCLFLALGACKQVEANKYYAESQDLKERWAYALSNCPRDIMHATKCHYDSVVPYAKEKHYKDADLYDQYLGLNARLSDQINQGEISEQVAWDRFQQNTDTLLTLLRSRRDQVEASLPQGGNGGGMDALAAGLLLMQQSAPQAPSSSSIRCQGFTDAYGNFSSNCR